LDRVLAQRFAYSIDHATGPLKNDRTLRQAADILRQWNGNVDASAAAPAIVDAARRVFWPMLLNPKLKDNQSWHLYTWAESTYVEEWMVMHTPARWLPPHVANWEDFLAAVVDQGLKTSLAPRDLTKWQQGKAFPFDIEHPLYSRYAIFRELIGAPIGSGKQPVSGDSDTVLQIRALQVPSERFTADLGDLDNSTLNLPLGQSGSPASPWFLDQLPAWVHGTTYGLPFSPEAVNAAATHTLTLVP